MGIEIERKFLVADRSILDGRSGVLYRQGYLSTNPERTVRVRRAGDIATITIKGITVGNARTEFEYPLPTSDVDALLDLCERPFIEKTRYRIESHGLTWEVDVFAGQNLGLVIAEVEIAAVDTVVAVPPWVGDEVTDDPRYFNAKLVSHPFGDWD
jgi:adenylate cyclase